MKNNRPFFVGYLAMPGVYRRFFSFILPVLILVSLGAAFLMGRQAQDAGTGIWDLETYETITGTVILEPYPMLSAPAYDDRPVLLVSDGKTSAAPFLAGLDGQKVTVTGNMIRRGRWRMLTIAGADAVSRDVPVEPGVEADRQPVWFADQPDGADIIDVVGEIVDSKCMLGAMRPGVGKIHRACAALCLMGGLPPFLMSSKADGSKAAYLLVGPEEESLSEALAPMVARPVRLAGRLEYWGSMPVLKVAPDAVNLLAGTELAAFGPSIGVADAGVFCRLPG